MCTCMNAEEFVFVLAPARVFVWRRKDGDCQKMRMREVRAQEKDEKKGSGEGRGGKERGGE
jgi:hypothetical protein